MLFWTGTFCEFDIVRSQESFYFAPPTIDRSRIRMGFRLAHRLLALGYMPFDSGSVASLTAAAATVSQLEKMRSVAFST